MVGFVWNTAIHSVHVCVVCSCHHFTVSPHTDVRDEHNQTPLHLACYKGHIQVVRYLVEECNVEIGE